MSPCPAWLIAVAERGLLVCSSLGCQAPGLAPTCASARTGRLTGCQLTGGLSIPAARHRAGGGGTKAPEHSRVGRTGSRGSKVRNDGMEEIALAAMAAMAAMAMRAIPPCAGAGSRCRAKYLLPNVSYAATMPHYASFAAARPRHDASESLHKVHPHCPHPRPLPEDVHRDREQHERQLDDSDGEKHRFRPVRLQPAIDEQAENQPVEDVLGEIERDQRFAGVLAVAVDAVRDGRGRAERAPKRDDAEEDGRHDPPVVVLCGPAKSCEADDRADRDGHGHDQPEFGLVEAAVALCHPSDDDVRNLARDAGAKDTPDKGREVDETSGQGREIISRRALVNGRDRLG